MVNSNRKGKTGELEAANLLREHWDLSGARRTQQYCGTEGTSDVVVPEIDWLHVEVKRVKKLGVQRFMDQARRDCSLGDLPLVLAREDNSPWLLVMEAAYLPLLAAALETHRAASDD